MIFLRFDPFTQNQRVSSQTMLATCGALPESLPVTSLPVRSLPVCGSERLPVCATLSFVLRVSCVSIFSATFPSPTGPSTFPHNAVNREFHFNKKNHETTIHISELSNFGQSFSFEPRFPFLPLFHEEIWSVCVRLIPRSSSSSRKVETPICRKLACSAIHECLNHAGCVTVRAAERTQCFAFKSDAPRNFRGVLRTTNKGENGKKIPTFIQHEKQEKQCTGQLQVRRPWGVCFGGHDPCSFCWSMM